MIDAKLLFSNLQAVTSTGATASTNVVDLGTAINFLGASFTVEQLRGKNLILMTQVGTAFGSTGASELAVALQDSADNSSFASVITTAAIGKATLVSGYKPLVVSLPMNLRRYLRVAYTVTTTAMNAGTISAWLALEAATV